MPLSLHFSRKWIITTLVIIAIVLAILGIAITAYEWSLGVNNTYWVLQAGELFNLTHEGNIPTWYSSILLFSSCILAGLIACSKAYNKEKWVWHWRAFSLLFLYLTLDEASAIHEIFTAPMREIFGVGGYLHFAWLIVGVPVAIIVGTFFLPFVLHLPRHTKMSTVASAIVYLGGAVVVEAISANVYYLNEGTSLLFTAIGTVEELLEMLGVIILIYGLLTYFENTIDTVSISLGNDM